MKLTNEEKEQILEKLGNVAAAFSAFQVSKDRLLAMSSLSQALIKFQLDEATIDHATWKYENAYGEALRDFYHLIGIDGPQDEFWKWLEAKKEAREKDSPPK